jgi:hypothetical protein
MHIVNEIEEPNIDNAVVMQGKPEQPQSVSTDITEKP